MDFQVPRRSTNPDAIVAYIQAIRDLTRNEGAWSADPSISYSLVYQMGAIAQQYAPDFGPQLQQSESQMLAIVASAGEVRSFLGPRANPAMDDEDINAERRRDRAIQRFQQAWHSGDLVQAKQRLIKVDDMIVRSQFAVLVRWKESLQALDSKDENLAMAIANSFPAGIKRAVLYAVIANKTSDAGLRQQALNLAWRDTESQIAERREYALLAISHSMLTRGFDSGYSTLAQAITAHNEALLAPRRRKFDPASVRKTFEMGRDPSFESSLLVRYGRPLYEVIDSGRSRFSFQLPAPGISAPGLDSMILSLQSADAERLNGVLNELRDEARLGPALVAVAELQLRR